MNSVIHNFAAIDIGSNAIRLLIYNIYLDLNNEPVFKKVALTRVPIRLGEDAFVTNYISDEKIEKLKKAMIAFKNLIEVHEVIAYKACATSAMREAKNAAEVVKKIKAVSGIEIDVIDGGAEADLIYNNHIAEKMSDSKAYLYIDIGGGSTEITLFYKGRKHYSESFNIGTVRMLHDKVDPDEWNRLKNKCSELNILYKNIIGIGSGGNIIKLQKLTEESEEKPFSRSRLKDIYKDLKSISYEDRMRKYGMNADRADVIIPASEILLHITKYAEIKSIFVPKIGLSDGIIHKLYDEYLQKDTDLLKK
jgi:exopolyphosphatase/guanosine-5'-triphosphate,3'-diphosphate pyrophosphatase